MRIVSLLPSATEIICALGLEDQLVGVSHECDFPDVVRELPKVTRALIPADAGSGQIDRLVRARLQTGHALYSLGVETLARLRPDLIVTQALCGVCAVAEDVVRGVARSLPGRPSIVNLEPESLGEVFEAIRQVASAAEVETKANEVIQALRGRVEWVETRAADARRRPRVALLEWLDPPFSCGHWNPELVRLAGGVERLGREGQRSRTLGWDEIAEAQPEVVIVACCGLGVERALEDVSILAGAPGWRDLPAVQSERVYVTDGSQYFSRPGPRLVDSLEILAHAMHPDVHPLPAGLPAPVRVTRAMMSGESVR